MLFPVWFPHRTSTQLWCMRSGEQDRVPRDWDDDNLCVRLLLSESPSGIEAQRAHAEVQV